MTDLITTITQAVTSGRVMDELSVDGIVLWLKSITGEDPIINTYPTYTQITLTPGQTSILQKMLSESMIPGGGSGDDKIRLDLSGVVIPVMLKYVIVLLLIAFALGYIIKR